MERQSVPIVSGNFLPTSSTAFSPALVRYGARTVDDCPRAVAVYSQRLAVEQHNRDLKTNLLLRRLHLKNPARMERMWIIFGLAFDISDCHAKAHETAFVERMSRRGKDGRHDLRRLNWAQCAALCSSVAVLFASIRSQ